MAENWDPIELAAKVIGHISQGMYRTPAGAIKELISNAYDADATYVKIHTDFPRFQTFSCEDDGTGIAKEKFLQLMRGGIGDSDKQSTVTGQTGKNGRPEIGRLGVGLLSLAQICDRFTIRSFHPETQSAFLAEIKFPPYSRKEIDRLVEELEEDETRTVKHGEFKFEIIDYVEDAHGITVTTSHLRDTFQKTLSNLDNLANAKFFKSKKSYSAFSRYLEAITKPALKSLSFASAYDQLLFGLALAAPIPYVEPTTDHNEPETVITQISSIGSIQEELKRYDFRVEVDNIELRRPLVVPSNIYGIRAIDCKVPSKPKEITFTLTDGRIKETVKVAEYQIPIKNRDERYQLFHFDYSQKVNGYLLEFSGYMFLQTTRFFPKEYQGVLIRIRNVAIGQYDVNVMTYPFAEGPRFSMLTSEIFVRSGLDDALKVDRDGFNTLDPQYIRVQAFVHSILHEVIFPESWGEEKSRNKDRRLRQEEQASSDFSKRLKKTTDNVFRKVQIVPKVEARDAKALVDLDEKSGVVKIFQSSPDGNALLSRKKNQGLVSKIIAAFEVANREGSKTKRREIFYELIRNIFDE